LLDEQQTVRRILRFAVNNHELPPAPGWPIHPSLITTGEIIPGYRVARVLFPVSCVESGFPEVALARLLVKAAALGANAIIGLRYAMSVNLHVSMSCMAYGTAVWVDYA
jgi:hypothetical protein